MKNVLVAMSGGVDSAASALILRNEGLGVVGITLLLSGNEKDAEDAAASCKKLRIEHRILDLREDFLRLVEKPFADDYLNGLTPNPCVTCNRDIKFGKLFDYADSEGFDFIATGHYVKKCEIMGHTLVSRADDLKKDQSYMLWQVPEDKIARSLFPLGALTKPEVRNLAAEAGLSAAVRTDSQDICFVPDGDYVSFIGKMTDRLPGAGNYLSTDGRIIGLHTGHLRYTVGQRKGLGVAFGEPYFVLSKCAADNTVTLGREDALFSHSVTVRQARFTPAFTLPGSFSVKIRYAHSPAPARITDIGGDRLLIDFETPQRAPAPGQSAAIYYGSLLCGGGIIE